MSSLGVTVTHCHAFGASAHVHENAWNGTDIRDFQPDEFGALSDFHSHLLLFGVEFPAKSTVEASAKGVSVCQFSLMPGDNGFCQFDCSLMDLFAGDSLFTINRDGGFVSLSISHSQLPSTLPPVALRTLPGVLRA